MSLQKIRFILEYFENEYGIDGWVTNLRPRETAQDWIHYRFTPEEVWRYLEARCPIPAKAAELRDMGITPEIAGEAGGYDEDGLPMTVGEAYCAGEVEFDWTLHEE